MLSLPKLVQEIQNNFPDATDEQVMLMAMRVSIFALATTCFPRTVFFEPSLVHHELYDCLENDTIEKLAAALPRGMAKSSIVSFLYPLWMVLNKLPTKDLFIVIISEAQSQSVNFLTRIKGALDRNPKIREYYGDLGSNTAKRWQEHDIILANGARILALGTGQKVRGAIQEDTRPNIIIVDDFESETNASTAEARVRNRKWMMEAVIPSMSQVDGRLILIGTTISSDCFLQWVKDAPDWKVVWKSIIDDDGESIWPEMYPLDKIEKIRDSYEHMGNVSGFFQEYMNEPQSPDDAPFKPDFIHVYTNEIEIDDTGIYVNINGDSPERRKLNVFIGVDLASSMSSRSDYTVLAAIGVDYTKKFYILDIKKSKSNPAFHADMIVEFSKKWRSSGTFIESIAYQEACRQAVRLKCQEEGIHIPGLERKITHKSSKSERLLSLAPLMASGRLYFRPSDLDAQREFLAFPRGKNDDIMDAIWTAITFSYAPLRSETVKVDKYVKKNSFDWMTI